MQSATKQVINKDLIDSHAYNHGQKYNIRFYGLLFSHGRYLGLVDGGG